jgi:hypothetical protein
LKFIDPVVPVPLARIARPWHGSTAVEEMEEQLSATTLTESEAVQVSVKTTEPVRENPVTLAASGVEVVTV